MSVKVSFRLDNVLYDSLRAKCPSVSAGCRTAIKNYIENNVGSNPELLLKFQHYNNYVKHLEHEILYVRGQYDRLMTNIEGAKPSLNPAPTSMLNDGVGMAETGLEPLKPVHTVNTKGKPKKHTTGFKSIKKQKDNNINKRKTKKSFWSKLGF